MSNDDERGEMTDQSTADVSDTNGTQSSDEQTDGGQHAKESPHADDGPQPPRYHPPQQDSFDWRGWLLVSVIVFSFLIIPATILYLPQARPVLEATGLSWRQAYLTLPMIPAILLGATAVWSALRSRSPNE